MVDGLRDSGITEPAVVLVNDENGRIIGKLVNGAEALQAPEVDLVDSSGKVTKALPGLNTPFFKQITFIAVAAQTIYRIPRWDTFFAGAADKTLTKNGVVQTFGVNFFDFGRTASGAPGAATVIDEMFGFRLAVAPVGGETLVFRFRQGIIQVPPASAVPVRLAAGVPDFSVAWNANGATPPNGVIIPVPTGYAVEFGRYSTHAGGLQNSATNRTSHPLVPYVRLPVDQSIIHRNSIRPATDLARNRRIYRWRYFFTGGFWSAWSSEKLVITNGRADFVGLPALNTVPVRPADPKVRSVSNLWIE